MVALGLAAALGCGLAVGVANYLLIRALRIPPIIATLSASFIIQSIDISYGRGLQIKPPPGFADFTNIQFSGVPLLAIFVRRCSRSPPAIALHRTVYGRSVLAIGQNIARRAARGRHGRADPLRHLRALRRARRPRRRAARRLFPRRQCRHRQRISAALDRRRRDRRHLGRGRQGQPARRLGRRAVPRAAADDAQHLRRQRRAAPGAHRRGHHRA